MYLFPICRRIVNRWIWPLGSSWRPCDCAIRSNSFRRCRLVWRRRCRRRFLQGPRPERRRAAICWIANASAGPCTESKGCPSGWARLGGRPCCRRPTMRRMTTGVESVPASELWWTSDRSEMPSQNETDKHDQRSSDAENSVVVPLTRLWLVFFFPLLFFFFFCVCRAFELTSSSSSFQCWHWPKCSGGLDLFDGRSFLPSFLPPLQRRRRKTSLVVKTRRGTHRSMSKSQLLLFFVFFYINGLSGLAESVRFRCVFVLTGEKSCPNDCGAGRETVGCDASSQPNCWQHKTQRHTHRDTSHTNGGWVVWKSVRPRLVGGGWLASTKRKDPEEEEAAVEEGVGSTAFTSGSFAGGGGKKGERGALTTAAAAAEAEAKVNQTNQSNTTVDDPRNRCAARERVGRWVGGLGGGRTDGRTDRLAGD